MQKELNISSEEARFESLIEGFLNQGFGVCDAFLDEMLVTALRTELLFLHREGKMNPAGIGKRFDYQQNLNVRGDVIHWIDPAAVLESEQALNGILSRFMEYLNRTCFTGLNAREFHYAWYAPNSFYKKHVDQFREDRGRKFSLVIYLNEDWQETDCGTVELFPESGRVRLLPLAGRAVFFSSSEMEHEVHPSLTRSRMSIAGWLKSV